MVSLSFLGSEFLIFSDFLCSGRIFIDDHYFFDSFTRYRMTAQDPKALKMFLEDVATTSSRIIARAKVIALEKASAPQSSREQIQLVPSSSSTTITFEVPDGPPPEVIELTGEGSESLDPILVKDFLHRRWDCFDAFPIGLKRAWSVKI